MKTKIFTTLFLVLASVCLGQSHMSVVSFKMLPNDMEARIKNPKTDQNGDKCAIIKIITPETGFTFDGGMLGIVSSEKKVGEYWLYIPKGSKKLTIKHNTLGVLRDYIYPEPIEEAAVYEMVLINNEIITTVKKDEFQTAWAIISSNPEGADVYIDSSYIGQTPLEHKVKLGTHTYQISKYLYQPKTGRFEVTKTENFPLEVTLSPNFGSIHVSSTPEDSAAIFINGKPTGKITPSVLDTLMRGEYVISLRKKLYSPFSVKTMVNPGQISEVEARLKPAFGILEIKTTPGATIFINEKSYGKEYARVRLNPGIHNIKVVNQLMHTEFKSIEVSSGSEQVISLTPYEQFGKIDISTNPINALVYLNDKWIGNTPLSLSRVLAGNHQIKIQKEGYDTLVKTITINPNQTYLISEKLSFISENEIAQGDINAVYNEGAKPKTKLDEIEEAYYPDERHEKSDLINVKPKRRIKGAITSNKYVTTEIRITDMENTSMTFNADEVNNIIPKRRCIDTIYFKNGDKITAPIQMIFPNNSVKVKLAPFQREIYQLDEIKKIASTDIVLYRNEQRFERRFKWFLQVEGGFFEPGGISGSFCMDVRFAKHTYLGMGIRRSSFYGNTNVSDTEIYSFRYDFIANSVFLDLKHFFSEKRVSPYLFGQLGVNNYFPRNNSRNSLDQSNDIINYTVGTGISIRAFKKLCINTGLQVFIYPTLHGTHNGLYFGTDPTYQAFYLGVDF